MRNTKQKNLVLEIINNSCNHLTAEEIYMECKKVIPNISLGTVYRNLNHLVESYKIIRIKMKDNIDRFDKNVIHSHVICSECGKIEDVMFDFIKKLPIIKDYEIMNYDLIFNGICKKCKEKEN
ncbi:MAG: transcriptional repressor [Bacilli bacterium]|nr:transcriptional repressor [Bacilli bacterium]